MFCESCGSFIPDGQQFCSTCGAPAPHAPAQPAAAQSQAAQPVQPVYQQPVYQQPVYQQPVYQQPVQPVYQQPVYQQPVQVAAAPKTVRSNGFATAGLVFGIFSFLFSWIPGVSYIFILLGLIFSIIGIARKNASGKGKAIAGLILTVLGLGLAILFSILWPTLIEYIDRASSYSSCLYDQSFADTASGDKAFTVDGSFASTDKGYACGVLHIDGYRIDF